MWACKMHRYAGMWACKMHKVRGYADMQDAWGTRICKGARVGREKRGVDTPREVRRLTVSATRAAVSNRVGKSTFSIKEFTAGACFDALERWRQTRILSGSPGPCVWIETMNGED
jgi:hypothetical protein